MSPRHTSPTHHSHGSPCRSQKHRLVAAAAMPRGQPACKIAHLLPGLKGCVDQDHAPGAQRGQHVVPAAEVEAGRRAGATGRSPFLYPGILSPNTLAPLIGAYIGLLLVLLIAPTSKPMLSCCDDFLHGWTPGCPALTCGPAGWGCNHHPDPPGSDSRNQEQCAPMSQLEVPFR